MIPWLPVCYGKSKKKRKLHLGNCVVPVLVLFCPCLVACELHADRETETVGGRVNGGGRLACIEKKGGGC